MNPDSPEEPDFRGQTLSPVSPKPLHFPKPSNIPLLEDQMDPGYNGSPRYDSLQDRLAQNNNAQAAYQVGNNGGASDIAEDKVGKDAGQIADASLEASLDSDFGETNGNRAAANGHPHNQGTANGVSLAAAADGGFAPASNPVTSAIFGNSQASDTPSVAIAPVAHRPTHGYESQNVDPMHGPNDQSSGVNIQAFLDNLSSSIVSASAPQQTETSLSALQASDASQVATTEEQATQTSNEQPLPAPLPTVAGLPPRPPPQNNPTNLVSESDLRSYHLHGHQQAAAPQKYVPPSGTSLRPPGNLPPPVPTVGAPGTSLSSNNLPPPPLATFQQPPTSATPQAQPSASTANYRQREQIETPKDNDDLGDEDHEQRWGTDVQRKYDAFLEDERMYVTRGEWHTFPANSRLFIGNLPTEKVTKRDLFHVFHKYGKLAQVSIKQAYGFIQYLEAQDCLRALQAEQGVSVRGRKIHLEISKPQRGHQSHNTGGGDGKAKANRRSRSPDYSRGGTGGNKNQRAGDRYRGGNEARHRDSPRGRDDYRPGRSPSPRPRGSRRSPNRRRRSRSRSPRSGYRSPSPRRGVDDDCPLPRRAPQDIPDVQIIAKDDPDRAFVSYVEKGFEARGIKCNVLILSPRLAEASVVRRQIIEGVLAVLKLDRTVQMMQKFQLSVFDRSGGANNVKFEEYADLELHICIELVLRAKQNAVRLPTSQYYGLPVAPQMGQSLPPPSQQSHQQQMPYQQYLQPSQPSSQMPSLDASSLQQLLGRAQQSTPQHPVQQSPFGNQQAFPATSDLSRLLASAGGAQQSQSPFQPSTQQQQLPPAPMHADLSSLVGLLGTQAPTPSQQQPQQPPPQQTQPQQKPDMANLMAMLGRYK